MSHVELFRLAENMKVQTQVNLDAGLLEEAVYCSWLRILSMVLMRRMTGW